MIQNCDSKLLFLDNCFPTRSDHPTTTFLAVSPKKQIVERQLDQVLSHWRARLGLEQLKLPTVGGGSGGGVSGLINSEPEVKPVVLRKRRQRVKSEANWALFYYQFNCDHAKPNLIWNRKVIYQIHGKLGAVHDCAY